MPICHAFTLGPPDLRRGIKIDKRVTKILTNKLRRK